MKSIYTKKIAGLLLLAFIVTAALIKWTISITTEPLLKERPDTAHAFQLLYQTPTPTTKFALDTKYLASVWFEQELNDGASDLYVVFTKNQKLDEHGELISCHACSTSIDAITFMHKSDGWVKEGTSKNIAELGSYGDLPSITKAKVLRFSPGNIALAIPTRDGGMGMSYYGEDLLNHTKQGWASIGYVDIASDNFGASCKRKGEPPSENPAYDTPCYSYTGTYKLVPSDNDMYPNILVSRRGQDYSTLTGKVEQVENDVYVFDGTKYLSTRQRLESTLRSNAKNQAWTTTLEETKKRAFEAGGLLLILALMCIYFLPATVASYRNHQQVNAILILNLLLGWTLLGWAIALVWAAMAIPKNADLSSAEPSPTSTSKTDIH